MIIAKWACALLLLAGPIISAETKDNPEALFDELWTQFDLRYALFDVKGIDWDSLHRIYRTRVTPTSSPDELFTIMSEMLGHLNDNHVLLLSDELDRSFSAGYLGRTINEKGFTAALEMLSRRPISDSAFQKSPKVSSNGIFYYGWIADDVGYFHIPHFNDRAATTADLDEVLAEFEQARALIVDVRCNQGGDDRVGKLIADRFADKRRLYMVTRDRIGAGHSDFGPPHYWHVEQDGAHRFTGPVILLQDRSTISAGENFSLAMRVFPQVTIVGDFTSGCFADMEWGTLPNGFRYSLSRNRFDDYSGHCWEGTGAPPDIMVRGALIDGDQDRALPTALALLQNGVPARQDESASAAAARISLTARLLQDAETIGPEAAVTRFRAAQKELSPDAWFVDADQMEAVGADLLRGEKTPLALIVYELNAEAFPDYPRAHYLLGTAYLRAGEGKRAQEAYLRARSLIQGKHPREIAMLVGMALRQCAYEGGAANLPECFKALHAKYPSHISPERLNALGYELIGAGKTATAVAVFEFNVAQHPEYANGYDSMGEGYMLIGEKQRAIANYERALELDPNNQNAVERLSRLRDNEP